MRPQGTRVLRRERRRAWKGTPGGRHPRRVRETYGQQHRLAEQDERHAQWMETVREVRGPRYGAYIRAWEASQCGAESEAA